MASEGGWYYVKDGQTIGPVAREELIAALPSVQGPGTLVWGPGVPDWTEARHVAALGAGGARPVGPPQAPTARRADEIDYELFGDDMQYVEIEVDPDEMVIAEAGAMMYMTPGVQMETTFGDPSQRDQGLMGKVLTAAKRKITGESLFMSTFTGRGPGKQHVAFAAPYPGKIIPMDLGQLGGERFVCGGYRGVNRRK